ncbi:MAG: PqiC family protein [Desulfobacteraceae bacterium]
MMENRNRLISLVWMLLICLLSAGGCAISRPADFFVLSPVNDADLEQTLPPLPLNITIGIGPVSIPRHLDRSEIIIKKGPNTIGLSDFNRWAGQLDYDILSVMRENLSILLSTDRIALYPWQKHMNVSCQIVVEIIRFNGTPGDRVDLCARWKILDSKKDRLISLEHTQVTEKLTSNSFKALVEGESRALAALSREIAAALRAEYQ